jgi:hypothetical protein
LPQKSRKRTPEKYKLKFKVQNCFILTSLKRKHDCKYKTLMFVLKHYGKIYS